MFEKEEELKNRVLNGGRGSGKSLRLLIEFYENKIAEHQSQVSEAKEIIDRFLDFEASAMERGIYIADDLRAKAKAFINKE